MLARRLLIITALVACLFTGPGTSASITPSAPSSDRGTNVELVDPSVAACLSQAPFFSLSFLVGCAREMKRSQQTRQFIAAALTDVIDGGITNMNTTEWWFAPSNWLPGPLHGWSADAKFDKWRCQNRLDYVASAEWAWSNGMGQCSEIAAIVYYVLKEAGLDEPYGIYTATGPGFSGHEFVIWGLAPNANLKDTKTWGPDAIVIDPWLGKAMTPEQAAGELYISQNGKNEITNMTDKYQPARAKPQGNIAFDPDFDSDEVTEFAAGDFPARTCLADTQRPGGGEYWIFTLTSASYGLYLGTEASLKNSTSCSFEGGGTGCKPTDLVKYRKLLGPFQTQAKAQEALRQSLTNCRVLPLGIGLKGQWKGSGTWYGLWHGSVSGSCPKTTN